MHALGYWLKINRIPIAVFAILLVHGSTLGLSDDEAYYWVLAQRPALSYAFHPPAVAWAIAAFQKALGWFLGNHNPGLVRLPALFSTAFILSLSLHWLKEMGLLDIYRTRAASILLSFFGFFSLAWMMVPDIPLFLGWTLLFTNIWRACFGKTHKNHLQILAVGTALTLLSKYSGILSVFSAGLSLLLWAPKHERFRSLSALTAGVITAAIPILLWNSQHQWTSILYQIHDRHEGAHLSLTRYFQFWLIESLLAGPLLIGFYFCTVFRALKKVGSGESYFMRYLAVWTLPAAFVFCVQPLISDFKPHWAFIVWWPTALALAFESQGKAWKWAQYQVKYGISVGIFILFSCHFPIIELAYHSLGFRPFDPKMDATNDLYAWAEFENFATSHLNPTIFNLPIVGARYQTASQAAFHLSNRAQVTLLPRNEREMHEWPDLNISDGLGPQWPKLRQTILFVSDNRYDSPPQFPSAKCEKLLRFEKSRSHLLAKWIDLWRCTP